MNEPGIKIDPQDQVRWMRSILKRFEKPLTGYAYRILRDVERARDVAQETFLKLWRDRDSIDLAIVPQWLFTVCRNQALDVLKKENRMSSNSETGNPEPVSNEPNPNEALEKSQSKSIVLKAVESLTAREQEAVRLRFQEELSYREISDIMGVSVSRVGVLLHTAMRALRAELQKSRTEEVAS